MASVLRLITVNIGGGGLVDFTNKPWPSNVTEELINAVEPMSVSRAEKAILAVLRDFMTLVDATEANRVYLRNAAGTYEVLKPSDGLDRRLSAFLTPDGDNPRGILAWSRKSGSTFGSMLAWAGRDYSVTPARLFAEVMRVVSGDDPIVVGGSVPADPVAGPYFHAKDHSGLSPASTPLAANPYYMLAYALSPIQKTGTVGDLGIVAVVDANRTVPTWDGALTPTDQYDIRVGIVNRQGTSPGPQPVGTIRLPPLGQGHAQEPSAWACKQTTNPTYNAANPWSSPFLVKLHTYQLASTGPGDTPVPGTSTSTSTWDSINSTPVETLKQDVSQSGIYENLGLLYLETGQLVWVLRKIYTTESKFRYRYACEFTVLRRDGTTVGASGFLHQLDKIIAKVHGIKSVLNGTSVYEDVPTGLSSIVRINQGAFPAVDGQNERGGLYRTGSPAQTKSFRGFRSVQQFISGTLATGSAYGGGVYTNRAGARDRPPSEADEASDDAHHWAIVEWAEGRVDGDFWILLNQFPRDATLVLARFIASSASEISVPVNGAQISGAQVYLVESKNRLWLYG